MTTIHLVPRFVSVAPQTVCVCTGLLAYIDDSWTHVDFCIECFDQPHEPCWSPSSHHSCPDPQPVTCVHAGDWNCQQPVSLDARCAHAHGNRECCGCCWAGPND